MSIFYCHKEDKHIDEDYDSEHLYYCKDCNPEATEEDPNGN